MQAKNSILTMVLALMFCAVPLLSGERFQGMVTYKVTSEDGLATISFYVTGDKTKFDVMDGEGQNVQIILDFENRKQMTIVESQKMAMVQAMPEETYQEYLNSVNENTGEYADAMADGALKATGNSKKIHGYDCQEFTFVDEEGGKGTIWNASGLGTFVFGGSSQGGAVSTQDLSKFRQVLGTDEFFPMEMTMVGDDGESVSMVATKVKSGALAASDFEVPSGYQVMDMSSQGMMQMIQEQMQNQGK